MAIHIDSVGSWLTDHESQSLVFATLKSSSVIIFNFLRAQLEISQHENTEATTNNAYHKEN